MNLIKKFKNFIGKEDDKMNFSEIADEWLEFKRISIKESTYYNYLINIEKHLKPYFKGWKINNISNYNELIQQLLGKLEAKTVRDIITILKAILKYYEEEYECKLKIKKVNTPKLENKKINIFTKKEKTKLEKYCLKTENLRMVGILICLNTGLRIGEICSLKWESIDLEERKIYVKNTVQRIYDKKLRKTRIIVNKPKTAYSIRTIPINTKLYEILKKLIKKYKHSNYVLSGTDKCVEPRTYQYVFEATLKKCKIKKHKFHCLRHTFATECIEVGMDIKSLSEILGHADVNTTLKIYVHSSNKQQKKFLEKL